MSKRLTRLKNSLVLKPENFKASDPSLFKIIGVFNPGVWRHKDEVILLVRVAEEPLEQRAGFLACPSVSMRGGKPVYKIDYLPTEEVENGPSKLKGQDTVRLPHISHFQIVRLDRDGYRVKSIETHPDLYGCTLEEEYGIEDPRMTEIDGTYYITYVSISKAMNVCTSLMSTQDFKSFKRHGIIFPAENKDVVLHPEKFRGNFLCYHRAVPSMQFTYPSMVTATSPNLTHWGEHKSFLLPGTGEFDGVRNGAGTTAMKTEKGWLQIYHGKAKSKIYSAGAVLAALDDPTRVIASSKETVLFPDNDFEINGYVSKVVFPTGWVPVENDSDKVILYYGCADTSIAAVTLSLKDILAKLGA